MPRFASYDGTELSYRVLGDGPPLVCLPGGPGRSIEYLGNLGGLDATRQLILLEPRGVGSSADPADPATFRVGELVRDVEALRAHLALDRMDLLAHSAGAVLGTLYAAAHPKRISRLLLITPGLATIDVSSTEEQQRAGLERSANEPWYPSAAAALAKIFAGDLSIEAFRESRPFYYGRWDETAQAHATAGVAERHMAAREGYFDGLVLDPAATRAALRELAAPVLLHAGELDPMVTSDVVGEAAQYFEDPTVVVQLRAAHFPWIDGPAAFTAALGSFLG